MNASPTSPSVSLVTVWIIEDKEGYRNTIKNILNNTTGMTCPFDFVNCESALEMLDSYQGRARPWAYPEVILLDIHFKKEEMTGLECISKLKERLPETQIVMLTIRDDASSIYEALQQGASGYLLKDSKFDEIVDSVRQASTGGMLMPASVADQVLKYFSNKPTAAQDQYGLSKREKEVLSVMAEGLTQKEIGDRLFIAPETVNTHICRIYKKLHVRCAPGAVAKAIREGLID